MLKIAQKRGRDWVDVPNCTPHHIHSLDSVSQKRLRDEGTFSASTTSPTRAAASRPASPFPVASEPAEVDGLLPRQRRQAAAAEPAERLFTIAQVKEIVARAVAERENQLRIEYDQILQQHLQEQFRSFSKFNEDYVSRQLKDTDLSYLS